MEDIQRSDDEEDKYGKKELKEPSKQALVRLCLMIVNAGRIACPTFQSTEDLPRTYEQQVIIPRILCVLVRDTEFTHWIPDLYHVTQHWINTSNLTPMASPDMERELRQHVHLQNAYRVNPADVLGYNVTEVIVDHPGNANPSRISWVGVNLKKPHYKWILRLNSSHRIKTEFRTDKMADRPRKHPGYFVSICPSSENKPKWHYTPNRPQWELVKLKDLPLDEEPRVTEFSRNKCEFEDLFNTLLPPDSPITKKGESWTMTLEGMGFTIESTEDEFILTEAKEDLVNAPPHPSTR
jgi:hypothetical protein